MKSVICICFLWVALFSCGKEPETGVKSVGAVDFLNSMGAVSSVSRRGERLEETIECIKYTGLRWLRVGYEDDAPVGDFIEVHKQTGIRFSYGLLSGHSDIRRLIAESKQLAAAGALLALEGLNEPNNWGITYNDEEGGGQQNKSWLPVAGIQRDLYAAVKNDPELKNYPVWSLSENGAQTDNAGLQFLTIPQGAGALMPDGTKYADYANCHNYIVHPAWPGLHDNQTWRSADPGPDCPVDGLYGNYGLTWNKKFQGYANDELLTLPRVTTETGYAVSPQEGVDEEMQARLYVNLYLSQFKRGWSHTAIYLLKGRSNEPEHESFALYTLDGKPKQAARYIHNLTGILADDKPVKEPGRFDYAIPDQPATVHDLLLQKSNGNFMLVIWGERFGSGGTDEIVVHTGEKYKSAKIYDITAGISPVRETKSKSIALSLTNYPVIVE
ncbi:MAG: glycosyl hydrolase, partial [Tannerella sp.]|nr:glycosyl hydrolase [Tannerella sp.]